MAAMIPPVMALGLRYAAVAAAGYLLARRLPARSRDRQVDAALDSLPEGLSLSGGDAARAGLRWRRVLRLGRPVLRIDAACLARLKVTRA